MKLISNHITQVTTEILCLFADAMMAYAKIIKENIEFDSLLEKYPYEQGMVEGIYELILETVLGKGESV